MKLVLLFALAACLVGCAMAAEPDVAATLSKRWGHWTLERLSQKKAEVTSDLAQTKAEKVRVHKWGVKICTLARERADRLVQIGREGVSEWTDILAIRRSQRGYHTGRQTGYEKRHVYITEGPLARRRATDKAGWCKKNKEACDRWRHEKALYEAHKYNAERTKHAAITAHAAKRVAAAKAALAKAKAKLAAALKKRTASNAACKKLHSAALAVRTKRQAALKVRLAAVNIALKNVRDARKKREAAYKPFYMTKCRYIGGKHHMYYCTLDTNNSAKAHHRFRVCKHRGPHLATVAKLKFRCYK